jgi:hypothetical protein
MDKIKKRALCFVLFANYWGDQIKKNNISGMRWGIHIVGKPEGKNHLEDLDADGRRILVCI